MLIDLTLPFTPERQKQFRTDREKNLALDGHTGTHLDKHLHSSIPLSYLAGRALMIDIRNIVKDREVAICDIDEGLLLPGDFILFRTGAMEKAAYGSQEYLALHPALSWELIEFLATIKPHFIGIDARGIRHGEEHAKADAFCERNGTFVIENMTNLDALPEKHPFSVHTMWMDFGGSGIPCRVVAELTDKTMEYATAAKV